MARDNFIYKVRWFGSVSLILAVALALAGCQTQPDDAIVKQSTSPTAPKEIPVANKPVQVASDTAKESHPSEASGTSLTAKDEKSGEAAEAEGRNDLEFYMMSYPANSIPVGVRQRAYNQLRTQMSRQKLQPQTAGWQSIGPAPLNAEILGNFNVNASGRTTAILINPTDPNTVYIGAAQGGVWKTTNGGDSWRPLTDDQPSQAVGAMAFDPTNPQVIYVGTGEAHGSADSYYGVGILKTTDGGASWMQYGADTFTNMGITSIVVNPLTPTIVYAALADFTNNTKSLVNAPGIYESTDGGATWALVDAHCPY